MENVVIDGTMWRRPTDKHQWIVHLHVGMLSAVDVHVCITVKAICKKSTMILPVILSIIFDYPFFQQVPQVINVPEIYSRQLDHHVDPRGWRDALEVSQITLNLELNGFAQRAPLSAFILESG